MIGAVRPYPRIGNDRVGQARSVKSPFCSFGPFSLPVHVGGRTGVFCAGISFG